MHDVGLFIHGHHVPHARVPSAYPGLNPATGETWGSVQLAGPLDVAEATEAARKASSGWRATTPAQRAEILLWLADLLQERPYVFREWEIEEAGKTHRQFTEGDHPMSVNVLRFFAGAARNLPGVAQAEYVSGFWSFQRREPVGVVAAMLPWNYPLMMAAWKVGAVLAGGNCLILKPALETPGTAVLLAQLAAEAGVPSGVLQVLPGGDATGRSLCDQRGIDMVALTGARITATQVMAAAAIDLKRVHFELGGKGALVVHSDARWTEAIEGVIRGGFPNSGQSCTQTSRVFVHEDLWERFVPALKSRVASLHAGDPSDPATELGPLISAAQRSQVEGYVTEAVHTESVQVLAQSKVPGGDGFWYPATVLGGAGLRATSAFYEEIFGPVIMVVPYRSVDEVIAAVNGTDYGLATSVWTEDLRTAMRMATEIEAGCVWINTAERLAPELPHGGMKRSGWGKDLGYESMYDYMVTKHVMGAI